MLRARDHRRDAFGVPTSRSVLDAVRAQGYVTAQDRLWQMDLLRRRALGELSEAFGEGALRADQEVRTLGLAAAARSSLPRLEPDLRALVEAYAAGVTAFIESHGDTLPVEFRLLRYAPRPWTAAHTVATGKLLASTSRRAGRAWAFPRRRGRQAPRGQDLLFPPRSPTTASGRPDEPPAKRRPPRPRSYEGKQQLGRSGPTLRPKPLLLQRPHLGLSVPSI